ncbi:SAM-dependent methyltransferase [Kribbella albertanoniae]
MGGRRTITHRAHPPHSSRAAREALATVSSQHDPHPDTADVGFNIGVPASARVWDCLLGGKNNYASDREVVAAIRDLAPEFSMVAVDNQQFLIRAGAYLAGELGITQFLDCGAGLPISNPLHAVVQAVRPDAKVLYIDNDSIVLAHARALLQTNDNTEVVAADIFDPTTLLENDIVKTFFDWSQPVAIIHTATLHHHPGEAAELTEVMQTYIDAVAAGSCTVISHLVDPDQPGGHRVARDIEKIFLAGLSTGWFRAPDEIAALFPGQELLNPGIVACRHWPNQPPEKSDNVFRDLIVGGIGRKPGQR